MDPSTFIVRGAVVRAAVVLAAFVGFAMVAPPTYEATTSLLVGGTPVAGTFRDQDPTRARIVSEEAAHREVTRRQTGAIPSTQPANPSDPVDEVARLVTGFQSTPLPSGTPERRATERVRLEIEGSRIRADLKRLETTGADHSDSPFGERPSIPDPKLIKRRLVEIEQLLASLERSDATAKDRAFATELGALLTVVPSPSAGPPAAETAEPATKATTVTALVGPDRNLLLLIGIVAASLAAAIPVAFRAPAAPAGGRASPVPVDPEFVEQAMNIPLSSALEHAGSSPPAESQVMAYPVEWNPGALSGQRHAEICDMLRSLCEGDCFVVGVSALGRAAASARIATEVAVALSDEDVHVLLLEADLGRPSLLRALGLELPADTDFADQLGRRIARGEDDRWYVVSCAPSLHVLASHSPAHDLLLSRQFEACINELRPFYDVIIVHAPSTSDSVACRAVDDVIDGLLLISDAGAPNVSRDGQLMDPTPFSAKRFSRVVTS